MSAIALSVLSGDSLADKSITSVVDLQNATPSLQVEPAFGGGQPQFRIRGVGFIWTTPRTMPRPLGSVSMTLRFALPIQTPGQLFDIDRVEVLRGPQGTLYGRNTTGGEINFISNRPTAETHAGFTAEYGSFNELDAPRALYPARSPRISRAAFRWPPNRAATGSAIGDTGQRLGDKTKPVAGRAQLEWESESSALDFRLALHWSQDKSDEIGLHLLQPYMRTNAQGQITTDIPRRHLSLCDRLEPQSRLRQADRPRPRFEAGGGQLQ